MLRGGASAGWREGGRVCQIFELEQARIGLGAGPHQITPIASVLYGHEASVVSRRYNAWQLLST